MSVTNHTGTCGTIYQTSNNQPATYGQTVSVLTSNGPIQGTMLGGYVKTK